MQLEGGQPARQLAELYLESKATPRRVAAARALFEEASLADFEPIGNRGRKWRHTGTGREYVIDEIAGVDGGRSASKSGVEFYVVHGDRLLFLRSREFDASERGVPGEIV